MTIYDISSALSDMAPLRLAIDDQLLKLFDFDVFKLGLSIGAMTTTDLTRLTTEITSLGESALTDEQLSLLREADLALIPRAQEDGSTLTGWRAHLWMYLVIDAFENSRRQIPGEHIPMVQAFISMWPDPGPYRALQGSVHWTRLFWRRLHAIQAGMPKTISIERETADADR